ncbi:MAG: acyl-CoA dehydratase activase [Oscillospiraceae bacterium]|nr:acyl-CoA dehydratase activase [Oscillospiraceae bacterium]
MSSLMVVAYTMGVDVGSSTSKCVIMRTSANAPAPPQDPGGFSVAAAPGIGGSVHLSESPNHDEAIIAAPPQAPGSVNIAAPPQAPGGHADIIATSLIKGGTGTSGPEKAMGEALEKAGLSLGEISCIVATGYGRNTFAPADKTFSELSCHARGAQYLLPEVRTVIDIGGQDCKAMHLTADGKLDGFTMNDKCAAGTGRFLEVMSGVLEIGLEDMGRLGDSAERIIDITSTCTVFAESEVISQLALGADKRGLIAGIHRSVAVKAAGIAKRLGVVAPVFMTGGVSQNSGVLGALESELGTALRTDPRAQLAGAIGAALLATTGPSTAPPSTNPL